MTQERSTPTRGNEGERRLAILLGVVGLGLGAWLGSLPMYRAAEERRWSNVYFETQRKAHPAARVERSPGQLWLVERMQSEVPPFYDSVAARKSGWSNIRSNRISAIEVAYSQEFRAGSDQPPGIWLYALTLLPALGGFLLLWLATRSVVWVVDGFR